jgi:hypothetical protein
MKITIYHTESSVDPAATVPAAPMIDAMLTRLEREYEAALLAEYPGAEIEFRREDNTHGFEIDGLDIMDEVHRILEDVYETGNFWP